MIKSRMDFAKTIEALREIRETTVASAAVPGTKGKRMMSSHDDIKKAREHEFKSEPAGTEEEMKTKKIYAK